MFDLPTLSCTRYWSGPLGCLHFLDGHHPVCTGWVLWALLFFWSNLAEAKRDRVRGVRLHNFKTLLARLRHATGSVGCPFPGLDRSAPGDRQGVDGASPSR